MSTMMERMAPRLEDKLLPQRRQEEPQHDEVWLVAKTHRLKGDKRSHDPGIIKLVYKTTNLKRSRRSHNVIIPQSMEREKTAHISGLQPLVLAALKPVSTKLQVEHILAICYQLPLERVREGEHSLKIIKLRALECNLES